MTFYEHTFIGKQDLTNKEVENLITKYSELINKTGKILKTEKWGLLNLSTKINNNKKGIFVHFKFESEKDGFRSTKHQGFVGTGYFDKVQNTITQGKNDTVAMKGSTEEDQFAKVV